MPLCCAGILRLMICSPDNLVLAKGASPFLPLGLGLPCLSFAHVNHFYSASCSLIFLPTLSGLGKAETTLLPDEHKSSSPVHLFSGKNPSPLLCLGPHKPLHPAQTQR